MEGIKIRLISTCSMKATYGTDAIRMRHKCNGSMADAQRILAVQEKSGLYIAALSSSVVPANKLKSPANLGRAARRI